MKKAYFVIAIIIISLLTIGFSAFENSLLVDDIAVEVRVKKDIRVTEIISATGNNGGFSETYDYNVKNINGTITLPNSNSSVTYQVKVTNIGNTDMGILTVNDLPSNLDYEITGYTEGEKLCNSSNVCSGGIDKSFNITIKYKNSTVVNSPINFIATFDFRGFHNINYNNALVAEVIDGGNKVVNLGNDAPDEVTIAGTYINQSYTKPNLTLEGVTTDINIEASSSGSGGTGTPEDPYIDNSETYDPTNVQQGTTIYNNVDGKPKVTVDENNKVTSFEFTNVGDGVTINSEKDGINTGFIPFESGKNFELKIRAYYPSSNKDNNAILLDVRNRTTNSGNSLQIAYMNKKSPPKIMLKYGSSNTSKEYSLPLDNSSNVNVTIKYQNGILNITNNGSSIVSNLNANITIDNMEILLGYTLNTSGNVIRKANATIYEFYAKEI